MTLEEDIRRIHKLIGNKLVDLGARRHDPSLIALGEATSALAQSDEFIGYNKDNIYLRLRDVGYDHETLGKLEIFEDVDPETCVGRG